MLKLKLPPVLVFILFAGFMWSVDRFLGVGEFTFFGQRYLMYGLGFLGIVVVSFAVLQFLVRGTTVDPTRPEKAANLVTTGIYRYTRNPMYLGMLLFLLAWGIHLGNAFNTLTAALFVAYMNRFQILPEEEALNHKFGKSYQQYCLAVRRWF